MLGELSLGLGDYGIIGGMIAVTLSIPTTLLVLTLRSLGERVGKMETGKADRNHIERIETRVEKIEQGKVNTRDWLRVAASQTNRQNRMSEQLSELGAKLDATLGIGAHLGRLTQAVERQTGQESHG